VTANLLREEDFLYARRLDERWTGLGGSRPDAIAAQQFCGNRISEHLIGRDGTNKTAMWKKYVARGNFAGARTFPTRHSGCPLSQGLFLYPRSQTGDW
jgi:hypothetical protein